jgi:hypothetical protein
MENSFSLGDLSLGGHGKSAEWGGQDSTLGSRGLSSFNKLQGIEEHFLWPYVWVRVMFGRGSASDKSETGLKFKRLIERE